MIHQLHLVYTMLLTRLVSPMFGSMIDKMGQRMDWGVWCFISYALRL